MITKQAIASATHDLMARKSLDKITVKDIVTECHITRQTFYYHFKDILDLFEWGIKQEMDQLLKQSQTCESIEETLLTYMHMNDSSDRRQLVIKIYKSRYRDAFHVFMVREVRNYFMEMCRRKKLLGNLPIKEADFLVDFYAGAWVGLQEQWLLDENMDVEEGIHLAVRVMQGELHI